MKTFEIWSEGYLCTGMEGIPSNAYKHGVATGEDFKEACCNFAKRDPVFAEDFNPEKLTYWGCKLYNNYTDAQRFTITLLNNRY